MSQVGRAIKNIEAPRPLKSQSSRSQIKNYMIIEELIQLIENVAMTLATGVNNPESMVLLVSNLRIHGPQLEQISKDTLDRAFVTFRNASQDERLNIMTRLNLLELIELRAKSWLDDGINTYYKHKATNVEPEGGITGADLQSHVVSTSPTTMAGITMNQTVGGSPQTMATHILGPGELIRTSGKFLKPTKIPGKNYSKDEVVIRNADSGKVMGIKGRRVHMIEQLSETIISFQRVNPGAKERLVQITGPNEEKINYAKHLIEDTIRRNASPVRLESTIINQGGNGNGGGGSCSSLASSASDEAIPRALNRNSIGTINNVISTVPGGFIGGNTGGKSRTIMGTNNQILLHSFSTNDASLGEYKYTVNVGQHLLKITGDCCELVRIAKLVLDDYFSSSEFLASFEAGASFDGNSLNSVSAPSTPLVNSTNITSSHQLNSSNYGDSYVAGQITNNISVEGDDEVFITEPAESTEINNLIRSKRTHFTRRELLNDNNTNKSNEPKKDIVRIVYDYNRLIFLSKSINSWKLPADWEKIVTKFPAIVRNKDLSDETNRFDADKYLLTAKSGKRLIVTDDTATTPSNNDVESPDTE